MRPNSTTTILTDEEFKNQIDSAELENHVKEKIQIIWDNDPSVNEVYLMDDWLGLEGAKLVSHAIKKNNYLTSMTLGLSDLSPEGIVEIANALETNTSLTYVDLGSSISDDYDDGPQRIEQMAEALKELLIKNKTLKTLLLGDTKLGYDTPSGQVLAEGIKQNQSLTNLNLCANCLDDKSGKAIREALEINKSLTELDLTNNEISKEVLSSINDLLTSNKLQARSDERQAEEESSKRARTDDLAR